MNAVLIPAAWIIGIVAVPCLWGGVLAWAVDREQREKNS